MSIKYSDPYGDSKFGKIQGEKPFNWFRVYFNEGKLYKDDDGYVLTANFTGTDGIQHSYSAKEVPSKFTAVLHLYEKDYEIRRSTGKKDEKGSWIYETISQQASLFEKWLCKHIEDNPAQWMPESQNIGGNISFPINPQVESMEEASRDRYFAASFQVSTVRVSGDLPKWEGKRYNNRKSKSNYQEASLGDKAKFVKQDLAATISGDWDTDDLSVGTLLAMLQDEYGENVRFVRRYIDILKAIVS